MPMTRGLGLLGGLPILIILFAGVYAIERFDKRTHDAWYWLCIVIMRTGATNIADYMAGRRGLHIDRITLSIGFGVLLAALAWWLGRDDRRAGRHSDCQDRPHHRSRLLGHNAHGGRVRHRRR